MRELKLRIERRIEKTTAGFEQLRLKPVRLSAPASRVLVAPNDRIVARASLDLRLNVHGQSPFECAEARLRCLSVECCWLVAPDDHAAHESSDSLLILGTRRHPGISKRSTAQGTQRLHQHAL